MDFIKKEEPADSAVKTDIFGFEKTASDFLVSYVAYKLFLKFIFGSSI